MKNKLKKSILLLKTYFSKYTKSIKKYGFIYSTEIFIGDIIIQLIAHQIVCNSYLESLFFKRRHLIVKNAILSNYGYIIKQVQQTNNNFQDSIKNDGPIWFCWLQGENEMPKYVKLCYEAIKQNNSRKVNLITMANYNKYIELPNYITEKIQKGVFSYTFFSDILRVNLLYKYGGLWSDSRILTTKSINEEYFNYKFFTIKNKPQNNWYVSNYRWTVGFMACPPHSPILEILKDVFSTYVKNEDFLLDYFLMDYVIAIAYENNNEIKKILDIIPYNNEAFFILGSNKNQVLNTLQNTTLYLLPKYNKSEFEKVLNDKSSLLNHILQSCN